MLNKEQIQRDIAVAFDFVEQIIDNLEMTDKIPEGSAIIFVDEENSKPERGTSKFPQKKYVKVKRRFDVL